MSLVMVAFTADESLASGAAGFFQSALFYSGLAFLAAWVAGVLVMLGARLLKREGAVARPAMLFPFLIGIGHLTLWLPFVLALKWR
jgi:hypothetical protein